MNSALDEVPPTESERMLRRWVAVDLAPIFPWRRYLPTLVVGGGALLLALASTLWWMRRLAREVHERRRAVEQLDDIGRTMPGVAFRYVLNERGGVQRTFFSSGVRAFLGFQPPPGQMLHDALGARTDAVHAEAARRGAASSLRSGKPFQSTYNYRHPDGRALQDQVQQEAAERHLLLASASHELRAPTHTLSLALQAIPPDSARHLRIARDAARTLGQLLDDVLDAARFQAKIEAIELRPQDFELHALIEQVCEAHAGPAAAKGLAFSWAVAADVPRMAYLDPLRLKQVLTNLLSNAVKYTAQGQVTLGVAQRPDGAGSNGDGKAQAATLEITIEDTGPGIAPALQDRLFEPFSSAPTGPGSSDLGLSICRRLTLLMGGSIDVDNRPDGGTIARLRLPGGWRARPAVPLRGSGCVLVCDDDAVCRILLAEALKRGGHTVEAVADGHAALQRWRAGGVRLLITDLTMGGLSGAGLMAAIRQEEAGQAERTAIIVCSGDLTPPAVADGVAPHHDGFLSKPLDLATLNDLLAALGLQAQPSLTL